MAAVAYPALDQNMDVETTHFAGKLELRVVPVVFSFWE
jgi:hypothetical protein